MLGGRWGSPAMSGPAGRRARPGDGPVVRSARLDSEADRLPDAGDLLGQAEAVARPCVARSQDHRVAARVPGSSRAASSVPSSRAISARSSSRSQLVERPKARALPAQRIGRREGLEPDSQQLELRRQRTVGCGRVHPGAEGLERRPQLRFERLGLALGGAPEAQGPHEAIGLEPRLPAISDSRPDADPPVEVDLPEAILAVAEALAEPEVVPGLARMCGTPQRSRRISTGCSTRPAADYPWSVEAAGEKAGARARRPSSRERRERPAQRGRSALPAVPARMRSNSGASEAWRQSARPGGNRPSASSFSRCACMTTAAAGRSSAARRPRPRSSRRARERSPVRARTSLRSRIRRCSRYSSILAAGSSIQGPWPGPEQLEVGARRRSSESR